MAESILIADDHAIVRTGVKLILKGQLPFAEIKKAMNGAQVISAAKRKLFDLFILDINKSDTDPFAMVRNLFAFCPDVKVLIFTTNSETGYARRFLQMGILA